MKPNPKIDKVFGAYPKRVQTKLQAIRKLIFETARKADGVGPLEEALRWGQPSYLTPVSKSGSTIRIDKAKGRDDAVAVFFHCQTNLVETVREMYPEDFAFEGNRALIMDVARPLPKQALRHALALALTYHLRKKVRSR